VVAVNHDPQVQDPRGSREEVGQGTVPGPSSCSFCGEEMPGWQIPDHVVDEHNPDDGGQA